MRTRPRSSGSCVASQSASPRAVLPRASKPRTKAASSSRFSGLAATGAGAKACTSELKRSTFTRSAGRRCSSSQRAERRACSILPSLLMLPEVSRTRITSRGMSWSGRARGGVTTARNQPPSPDASRKVLTERSGSALATSAVTTRSRFSAAPTSSRATIASRGPRSSTSASSREAVTAASGTEERRVTAIERSRSVRAAGPPRDRG